MCSTPMEFKTGDLHRVLSICAEASPVPDAIGQTALFYAVQRPSDSEARGVADCLISVAGIDPSRKDFGGQSPLFYAAAVGNVETIKLLLSAGCDANERDNLGQTPLFYASRDGRIEVVRYLLSAGSNPNQTDRNAQTALFYAARENRRDICQLLIDNGASAEYVDLTGRRAAYFAKLAGHSELAAWLSSLEEPEDLENPDRRKRCRLVFVSADGAHLTPSVEQLEWIEAKFPEICVWAKDGPIATSLAIPAPVRTAPSSFKGFPKKKAAPAPPAPKPIWMTAARQMVSEVFKKEDAWIFVRPVDPVKDMCPDYLTVIKEPMDFGTIRRKMGKYANKAEFSRDVGLVFSNCRSYNKPGTLPEVLCARVEAFWKDLETRYSFAQIPDSSAAGTAKTLGGGGADEAMEVDSGNGADNNDDDDNQ